MNNNLVAHSGNRNHYKFVNVWVWQIKYGIYYPLLQWPCDRWSVIHTRLNVQSFMQKLLEKCRTTHVVIFFFLFLPWSTSYLHTQAILVSDFLCAVVYAFIVVFRMTELPRRHLQLEHKTIQKCTEAWLICVCVRKRSRKLENSSFTWMS